jgi:HK97 family phage prohead protease
LKRKTFELLEVKTDEDGQQPGSFSALASVFGNVDHVGDRVMPGAFSKTLKKWRESGRPLPVILSHLWDNPFALVGKADPRAVIETEDGLLVQGTLDIEGNDTAKQVHKLMKEGLMTGWSFGYTVPDGGERLNDKDGANEITEIDLVEVGPTLKGANPEARLQEVKSALDHDAPVEDDVYERAARRFQEAEAEHSVPDDVKTVFTGGSASTGTNATVTLTSDSNNVFVDNTTATDSTAVVPSEPKDLPAPSEIKNVESEKPVEPVKPAANDPLKDAIDRLRLEIAVGKRL